MKNLFIVLLLVLSFGVTNAQINRSVIENSMLYVYGRTQDTLILGGSQDCNIYAKPFMKQAKLQTNLTRSTGDTTSMKLVVESSLDYSNWSALTTVTVTSTEAESTGTSSLLTVYAPYIRVRAVPLTYSQTVKYKFYWLIVNN